MQMSSRGKNDKYECKSFNGTVERKPQETKTEPCRKKSPLRIQNDWSEHISSKGLIYYYNCRTEVSQWQKPSEWTLTPMTQDEIKRILNAKPRNGDNNTAKRTFPNTLSQDLSTSPKRIKLNNQQLRPSINNNNYPKLAIKCTKVVPPNCNTPCGNNLKNKHTEANFNNDDMDISPNSSPMSRGSHSDESEQKKYAYNNCDAPITKNQIPVTKSVHKLQISPGVAESTSANVCGVRGKGGGVSTTLTQYQVALANVLRTTLTLLQVRSPDNRHDTCLSVAHISDLLTRCEAVLNNGATGHSYRSHRLQTQLLQNSSYAHCNDPKAVGKLSANIAQIKELVKYLQDFIQDNYPNTLATITPVSPNYSKTVRIPYYLQVLQNLIETCLHQLSPQSLNSPSSTSSPGSLKDNNSTISVCTSVTSHSFVDHSKPETESPTKKEKPEPEKPKSVLSDPEMIKFVSNDLSNSYRNQLADCYVQEAQIEYYKFVRLHSVLYPELACESKKLKALVRISEINTELFKHKKEDIERLVHMLECRTLPNHLRCDYVVPNN